MGSLPLIVQCLLPVPMAAAFAWACHSHLSPNGMLMLIAGCLTVYTGDRLLEPGRLPGSLKRSFALLTIMGVIGCLVALATGFWNLALPTLGLGIASLLYPLMSRVPGLKAPWVGLVWTLALSALPQPGSKLPWTDEFALFFLFTGTTVLCDIKDQQKDQAEGIPSLPVLLPQWATLGTVALFLVAALVFAWGTYPLLAPVILSILLLFAHKSLSNPIHGPILVDATLAAGTLAGVGLIWIFV